MESILVFKTTMFKWGCPKCEEENISDIDDIVCCYHCDEEFKVLGAIEAGSIIKDM